MAKDLLKVVVGGGEVRVKVAGWRRYSGSAGLRTVEADATSCRGEPEAPAIDQRCRRQPRLAARLLGRGEEHFSCTAGLIQLVQGLHKWPPLLSHGMHAIVRATTT